MPDSKTVTGTTVPNTSVTVTTITKSKAPGGSVVPATPNMVIVSAGRQSLTLTYRSPTRAEAMKELIAQTQAQGFESVEIPTEGLPQN